MLTFVKDKSATEVVGIYSKSSRSAKPQKTVYYTHDGDSERPRACSRCTRTRSRSCTS